MERICSPWEAKFFFIEKILFQKGLGVQVSKQEVVKVLPFVKYGWKITEYIQSF